MDFFSEELSQLGIKFNPKSSSNEMHENNENINSNMEFSNFKYELKLNENLSTDNHNLFSNLKNELSVDSISKSRINEKYLYSNIRCLFLIDRPYLHTDNITKAYEATVIDSYNFNLLDKKTMNEKQSIQNKLVSKLKDNKFFYKEINVSFLNLPKIINFVSNSRFYHMLDTNEYLFKPLSLDTYYEEYTEIKDTYAKYLAENLVSIKDNNYYQVQKLVSNQMLSGLIYLLNRLYKNQSVASLELIEQILKTKYTVNSWIKKFENCNLCLFEEVFKSVIKNPFIKYSPKIGTNFFIYKTILFESFKKNVICEPKLKKNYVIKEINQNSANLFNKEHSLLSGNQKVILNKNFSRNKRSTMKIKLEKDKNKFRKNTDLDIVSKTESINKNIEFDSNLMNNNTICKPNYLY
jgi:hypothetical protein